MNGKADEANPDERPAKKQKTELKNSEPPKIIKLTASPNSKHVVAITDDKCLRVFDLQTNGNLAELSQRCMPKRPCAVQVLPDNATVICADKFGDVYSLPLLPSASENETATPRTREPAREVEHDFKPTATNHTVHTQRNRKALEAQLKQNTTRLTPRKEPLRFEHTLLLGHVSMLTDVKFGMRDVQGKKRRYIITADRDEHIRISRGPPQTHIIEGYCLGHKAFVSKICVLSNPDLLVSGGGDDWLGVWSWAEFHLRNKFDLRPLLRSLSDPLYETADYPFSVSGLWNVDVRNKTYVVVALERVPTLFLIPSHFLTGEATILEQKLDHGIGCILLKLDHAPLDVVVIKDMLIVCLDAREDGQNPLVAFTLGQIVTDIGEPSSYLSVVKSSDFFVQLEGLEALNEQPSAMTTTVSDQSLDDFLYGISNLRKRSGGTTGEED